MVPVYNIMDDRVSISLGTSGWIRLLSHGRLVRDRTLFVICLADVIPPFLSKSGIVEIRTLDLLF